MDLMDFEKNSVVKMLNHWATFDFFFITFTGKGTTFFQ